MRAQLARDLLLVFRTGGGMAHSLVFFLIFGLLIVLSDSPDQAGVASSAIGFIWFGVLFSCLLNLDFAFRQDFDDGTYEHLMAGSMPLDLVILAKILFHYITVCLPLAVVAPVIGIILGLSASTCGFLLLALLVGTPAISAVGGLGTILGTGIRRSALLQSLLCLPLCIPTLVFGISAVPVDEFGPRQLTALALTSAIALVCLALVPYAAAYSLRSILAE